MPSKGSIAPSPRALSAVAEPIPSGTDVHALGGTLTAAFALPALILGFGIRLLPVLTATFPLNDGGMFYSMVEDLKRSHFALPAYTSYNGGSLPYTYPPLGFYAGAAMSELLHVDVLTVLRILPALVSCLTLLAFYRLATRMLVPAGAVAALFAFALLPRSFEWEVMGGGLTRSFGFLFAVLALTELYGLLRNREAWRVISASVFCGLTLMSHLEFGWFLAFSAALFVVAFVRSRLGIVHAALVGIGTLAVSSPWWLTIVLLEGLRPLLAAGQTGGALSVEVVLSAFAQLDLTQESLFSPALVLGAVGVLVSLRDRRYLLPAWIATSLVLDPRNYLTDVAVPLALLVGVAFTEFLIPFFSRGTPELTSRRREGDDRKSPRRTMSAPRWFAPAVLGAAVMYSLFSAIGSPLIMASLATLPTTERAAMAWAASNTPAASRFLVISGEAWAVDRSAEWFPALAGRVSVATVQGSEWLQNGGFAAQLSRDQAVQACAVQGSACLASWSRSTGVAFDYVYVDRRPPVRSQPSLPAAEYSWALEYALRADPDYRVVYDGPGAVIFAVVRPPATSGTPSAWNTTSRNDGGAS